MENRIIVVTSNRPTWDKTWKTVLLWLLRIDLLGIKHGNRIIVVTSNTPTWDETWKTVLLWLLRIDLLGIKHGNPYYCGYFGYTYLG